MTTFSPQESGSTESVRSLALVRQWPSVAHPGGRPPRATNTGFDGSDDVTDAR
jgi:hypothetical protein